MPTFDFANVLRKLLAAAVSAAASPVTAVLAGAALLSAFLDDIIQFFTDDFSLPTFQFPSINLGGGSDILSILLYAVNFDLAADYIDCVLRFVSSVLAFGVKFFISLNAILVSVGVYRVVRRQLKDVVG